GRIGYGAVFVSARVGRDCARHGEILGAYVAVAYCSPGDPAIAGVNLDGQRAGGVDLGSPLALWEVHDLGARDPPLDVRRVVFDPRSNLVELGWVPDHGP